MKQKIRVLDIGGNVSWVEGTPVVIPRYEQYGFVFCKHEHMKGYIIREISTGLAVYPYWEWAKKKAQAIEIAQRYLIMYHNMSSFSDKIQGYLDEHNDGKPINEPIKKPKIKQRSLFDE
jgi:hypothetical protein